MQVGAQLRASNLQGLHTFTPIFAIMDDSLKVMHYFNTTKRSKIIGGIARNAGIMYARENRAQIASAKNEG